MKILNLNDLSKEKEQVTDWTALEMEQAVINGYLLYYWAIYKHSEQDRRKAA